MRTFSDGRIFGEQVGSGRPEVLALHGWRRDRRDLVPAVAGLNAVAVDLPGFGATPPPEEAWGTAEYAAMLGPIVAEMDRPVVVLGHSFGGRVAVQLAATRPEAVRALVLTGVPLLRPPAPRPARAYRLARALHRAGLVGDGAMEAVRARSGSADYRQASGIMRQVLVRVVNESYEDELGSLDCPVELVWGERDAVAPLEMARAAARLVADARLTVCPGADHFSFRTHPEELRAALARHHR
ncbi:MAG: alpha/beta fold hydrolase [Acidimicrobiales bacterium]